MGRSRLFCPPERGAGRPGIRQSMHGQRRALGTLGRRLPGAGPARALPALQQRLHALLSMQRAGHLHERSTRPYYRRDTRQRTPLGPPIARRGRIGAQRRGRRPWHSRWSPPPTRAPSRPRRAIRPPVVHGLLEDAPQSRGPTHPIKSSATRYQYCVENVRDRAELKQSNGAPSAFTPLRAVAERWPDHSLRTPEPPRPRPPATSSRDRGSPRRSASPSWAARAMPRLAMRARSLRIVRRRS